MNTDAVATLSSTPPVAPPPRYPWYHWRRLGLNFLTLSILAHILFGVAATYFIVQTLQAKRKQTFAAQPASSGAPGRTIEHKVQMQKKQATMSAPAPIARITTTGASKVVLPAMPLMPHTDSAITPLTMAGMGGTGTSLGLGMGTGTGDAGGSGGGGGGGGKFSFVGSLRPQAGLVGTFYDLKQSPTRQPTPGMNGSIYGVKVKEFVHNNFNAATFASYYKGSKPIYATRIFTPDIDALEGPAAFGLEKEVEPKMWVVHFKGSVIAPDSGTYHFTGVGDDVLIVRFNNQVVLDACWFINLQLPGETFITKSWCHAPRGLAVGLPFKVEEGKSYPIEVLIGEQPGGRSCAQLLIEKEGASYSKDKDGNNILPMFSTSSNYALPPPPPKSTGYAPHTPGGPVWKSAGGGLIQSAFQ